jgi:signal transduction histidine kinase
MHHAQASEVKIKLEQKKNKIELSIVDNGKGFEHENRQSFGLRNMQGRAASINGNLQIESKQSKGTKVSVSVDAKR